MNIQYINSDRDFHKHLNEWNEQHEWDDDEMDAFTQRRVYGAVVDRRTQCDMVCCFVKWILQKKYTLEDATETEKYMEALYMYYHGRNYPFSMNYIKKHIVDNEELGKAHKALYDKAVKLVFTENLLEKFNNNNMNVKYINNDNDFRTTVSLNESRNKWEKLFEDFGDENLNEADDSKDEKKEAAPKEMTDDEIKEKAFDFAIDIAKLMSNVMVDDIVGIAGKVADFLKNHQINGAGADAFSLGDESSSEEAAPAEGESASEEESTEENNEGGSEDNTEFQEA